MIEEVKSVENINEPVLSFVKCVKHNPKRFSIEENIIQAIRSSAWRHFILTDKQEKIKFSFRVAKYPLTVLDTIRGVIEPEGLLYLEDINLTHVERKYLYDQLSPVFMNKKARLTELKNTRRLNRLMKIYCKENKE